MTDKARELISKYIAKRYQSEIHDFYQDQDGWWIELSFDSKYCFKGSYADKTIHEDTLTQAVKAFRTYIAQED